MADDFKYDAFLSHSSKDKEVVRTIAERLQADELRVWFDEWEIRPGDNIQAKIEEGLEYSRVQVLCMSANAFGSDWVQLESHTFRFRDPLNKERRFIPLRLDAAPIKGSLAQFLYINWLLEDREQEYAKLLEACRLPVNPMGTAEAGRSRDAEKVVQFDSNARIFTYAFSPDGKRVFTGSDNGIVWLWNMETGRYLGASKGQDGAIVSVALSDDQRRALSGGFDDNTVWLWDVTKWRCKLVFKGHYAPIRSVAWSPDQRQVLSGSTDKTARLWDVTTGLCLHVLKGHTESVMSVAWSPDQRQVLSGSADKTVRLWDVETGHCLRVLEGHTGSVRSVVWSPDQRFALSASVDKTVRLWDVETGRCLRVFEGHTDEVRSVAWSHNQSLAFSGDRNGGIRVWNLSEVLAEARESKVTVPILPTAPEQIQYTNAKVLLVGESGAGKTGLSKRLALNNWQPSDSTIGAWATQWKLPVDSRDGFEREIWLWDFGGQADQRLIHQLYMDETALAVLVFDGQKEDMFETLGQWDRDLTRASQKTFAKLLVAGRVDAGGLRVSRTQVEAFTKERGYTKFLETSAKQNIGCEELKDAVLNGIRWGDIPWRSSPLLFKRLKEEIIRLKDEGRVLIRFNELRETLQLRLMEEKRGEIERFTDDELKAVVSLLAGPGVLWELKFGSWVLLQPERINAYAQAVIQTLREDEHERGCLPEERVLNGNLTYLSSLERLPDSPVWSPARKLMPSASDPSWMATAQRMARAGPSNVAKSPSPSI
jgi:small GTP-binding protein